MDNKTEQIKQIRLDIAKEQARADKAEMEGNTSEKIRAELSVYDLEKKLSKLFKTG